MIYITDAKGDGRPCLKVYEGKVMKWYYCESEDDLFSSFINLLKYDKNFRIYNVYGKKVYIPNDPELFKVKEELEEFEGIIYNLSQLSLLIKISKEINGNRKKVKVKLKNKMNAEEVLKLGVKIMKPVELPRLF
ncbi:hypothetical protein [Saccharolobus caldissimus]|uniref:Uncharacterized protein n=1 Tax=Saccharolobus caldissimus TaxID=1702097 RepID=A0AAQ4CRY2_9CREN|nr:hypothetical protein [Saccharolobus caldissimus]BDB98563.1 hypothetical protein SACC_15800 [Saccharolobus caldissimus]